MTDRRPQTKRSNFAPSFVIALVAAIAGGAIIGAAAGALPDRALVIFLAYLVG